MKSLIRNIILLLSLFCVSLSGCAKGTIANDKDSTSVAIPQKHFSGSFIQNFLVRTWDDNRWNQEMEMLKEAGIKYLIYAPALLTNNEDVMSAIYPTNIDKVESFDNTLEKCLKSAQKNGMKIFIGLNFNDRWWRGDFSSDWLDEQMMMGNQVADELLSLYKNKYPDAMYGWYWVWEMANVGAETVDRQSALAQALNVNLDHLNSVSPDMPFMLSPFMNEQLGTASSYGDLWKNVFSQTHFRSGDIFAPQDCIGAGGLTIDVLAEWFRELKRAVDSKPGLLFWSNVEIFDTYWASASLTRIQKQMDRVAPYVSDYICFAYSHYYSPFEVYNDYHKGYISYLNTGNLPQYNKPKSVSDLKLRSFSQGIELIWNMPDLDDVAGVNIYRDKVLIAKLPYKKNTLPNSFYDKNGYEHNKYEVATYNVIDQESVKVKAI